MNDAPAGSDRGAEPLLDVAQLAVYYGDAQALADVSLQVQRNEIVAIIGANGAGKTSLIRAIGGVIPPRGGSIRFDGREIAGLGSHRICEAGVGQVAEGRQVFPSLSVLENLELGGMLKRARGRARQTLDDVFELFPRLQERLRQPAGTLSGGEQQMLAIGRCLMAQPKLVMFDEPSLGLAPTVVHEVFAIIRKLHERGLTIMLVEQNVAASLKLADRAYVLENGQVVLAGPGRDLLEDPRVRTAYLGL